MHAYTLSRQQLERDVREALHEVVAQLEKNEEIGFISDKMQVPVMVTPPADATPRAMPVKAMIAVPAKKMVKPYVPEANHIVSAGGPVFTVNGPVTIIDTGNTLILKKDIDTTAHTISRVNIINRTINSDNNSISIIDIDSIHSPGCKVERVDKSIIRLEHSQTFSNIAIDIPEIPEQASSIWVFPDSATATKKKAISINRKAGELKQVINKLVFELEDKKPEITKRVHQDTLIVLLNEAFTKRKISSPYSTGILNDSAYSAFPDKVHTYTAQLFPNDIFSQKSYLMLNLHQPGMQVVKGMWGSLAVSLFFSLLIIGVFYLSVQTILKQKKLSNMKNDFINNMTHELKTPIATISIATDALNIDSNKERVSHYTHVIKEENERMNRHIEQVLQMAVLEKRELELNTVAMDVHELIRKVASSFTLPLEARHGQIRFKLQATHTIIEADPYHITNVLNNLVDNAIKYSVNAPEIDIISSNHDDYITITVRDKGKGMSKEAQKHIFDKFYRVPSGNIHDVKGFGLGLSYVKTIVESHKGTISVTSTENEGSSFTLQLKTDTL